MGTARELAYFTRNAHSLFVETLGELGRSGFLLLLAFAAFGLATAIGRLRAGPGDRACRSSPLSSAAFVAFLLAAATDWIWDLTVVGVVGVVCLALLTGPATVARAESPVSSPAGAGVGRGAASAGEPRVVVVALGVVVAQAIPLATQMKIRDEPGGAQARRRGRRALRAREDARTFQGWAASHTCRLRSSRRAAAGCGPLARRSHGDRARPVRLAAVGGRGTHRGGERIRRRGAQELRAWRKR